MPLADFDGDGDADGADFVAWQTNFPNAIGFGPDVDGDGDTDGKEYVAWLVSYPTTPTPANVPEPASGLIMAAAMLFLISRQSLRRPR